ncbi:cupredoxin domain-containing protein [Candidatus Woesearchaeota archaeon]|nr:cupredoxin domain-containing protein [Candidatus Woesearchaeota archaeon]
MMKKEMMFFWTAFIALLVLFFSGCTASIAPNPDDSALGGGTPVNQGQADAASPDDGTADSAAPDATTPVKQFSVEAKQFEFVPGTLIVNKGDFVKLTVTSTDVEHGFAIPEFGVNVKLPPNEPQQVEFIADKSGEFTIMCSVYCGSGHREMKGLLIVNE